MVDAALEMRVLSLAETVAENLDDQQDSETQQSELVTNGALTDSGEDDQSSASSTMSEQFTPKWSRLSSSSLPHEDCNESQLPSSEEKASVSSQPALTSDLTERYEQRLRRRGQKNLEMKERLVKIRENLKRSDEIVFTRKRFIVGGGVIVITAVACLYVYYKWL
ncbi:unnamed protein product [Soboliphyme baturini]|uniref:Coiled-coil domain-containing protein 167 n=1 Tax=Soboliphyme baturini TaxID=241478 RepID=A0A183J7X7_9BILA|nr:unnamed protein product [Soboliphyme baturini]